MAIPREPNGRPLTLYTLDLEAALEYAREALSEGLNVEITDRDLRDTQTYRSFQESPVLVKYWGVSLSDDASARGLRSTSAHQIIDAVEMLRPEDYGAIHADDLVEFCKAHYLKTGVSADSARNLSSDTHAQGETYVFGSGKTLSSFKVGDKVTVRAPSDRPLFHHGSHGTVVTVGTKRVHVRMDTAGFENHDGEVANFLPADLDMGHVGTPRSVDRMNDAFTSMKLEVGADLVSVALDAGIITADQRERIKTAWANHLQS
ncbi:hypothetical protein ACFYWO_07860 [Streptomyces sp. NPDC002932]|uniref:hypothetical protein n=1 Tax=Streptomyces sp. NPDC002932 TaxID=3364672 RepID=UPI00369DC437